MTTPTDPAPDPPGTDEPPPTWTPIFDQLQKEWRTVREQLGVEARIDPHDPLAASADRPDETGGA
jgi:hypothetical protein